MSGVCFVFEIVWTIFMPMPFTVTQGMIVHFMTDSLTSWLEHIHLTIKLSLPLLVMPMLIDEWLESVYPTDRHGGDILYFCNVSGCKQLVRCSTHISGNRLDLMMADDTDILHGFGGSPLGTSGHCFVSCVIRVEQAVPE